MRYYVVDAFTDRSFAGNSAAVVFLDRHCDDRLMQMIAMEFNLAETAFLTPSTNRYGLRWFTPTTEVDLCGHATLASAAALIEMGKFPRGSRIEFDTRSGVLAVERNGTEITMDFPAIFLNSTDAPFSLTRSLGAAPLYAGRGAFDFLVEVESEKVLRELRPDLAALALLDCRGVCATAVSETMQYDFVSRFFAPSVGIDEDPVTGSAHCMLAPYWSQKLGKSKLVAYQASPRGGVVTTELRGNRVLLTGTYAIFSSGDISLAHVDSHLI